MEEIVRNQTSGLKPRMQEQKKQRPLSMQDLGRRKFLLDGIERSVTPAVADKGTSVNFKTDAERNLDGIRYRLGDMVWAKVKSHPWWPGQLYDPNLAASSAMELKRDNCFLVAFFGDSTFGWFSESELIPFEPNFVSKANQTTAPNFVDAVEDALDEFRRRVKLGLTCRCCIASNGPQMVEGKPGLLYDRQLREIRKNFEPAKLLSFIKRLACAPLSSRDMLKSTLAGAQGVAMRVLASHDLACEHKAVDNLDDHAQSDEIMMQGSKYARTEKGKSHLVKAHVTQKKQLKASPVMNVSPSLEGVDSSKKKPRKLNTLDEIKAQPSSVVNEVENIKKKRTENEKALHGGEGNAKKMALKSREHMQKESDKSKSTSCLPEIFSSNACKEQLVRDYSQSGQSSGQIESSEGSDLLKLAVDDISAVLQEPDLPTNSQKSYELTHKHTSGTDHGKEATAFELLPTKSPKVKRLVKKVQVFKPEQDSAVKAKGTMEDHNQEGLNASHTKKKKQRLSAVSEHKYVQGDTEGLTTPDFVSKLKEQETENVSVEKIHQQRSSKEPYVEGVMSSSTAEDAAANSELVMRKEVVIQEKEEFNVAVSVLDVEQGVHSGFEPRVCSFEAESVQGVSKEEEEEHFKGTNTASDGLKPEKVQVQSREEDLNSMVVEGSEANRESIPTGSTVSEDATSKDLNAACSKVRSDVCAGTILSSGASIVKEGMSRKGKEPSLGKHVEDDKKHRKTNKEVKVHLAEEIKPKYSNKANAHRKRVSEENDCLSKDSRVMMKKFRSTAETACETLKSSEATNVTNVARVHEDLHEKGQGDAQLHDLQDGVVALAVKTLEVGKSDIVQLGQCLEVAALGDIGDSDSGYGSRAAKGQAQVGEEGTAHAPEAESCKVELVRQKGSTVDDNIGASPKIVKKSVSFSKTLSSSSISLRPVFEAKIPLHGSRGVSNRFGQRVVRQVDEADRVKNSPQEGTLMIKFPKGFLMPSERQLRKMFGIFGDLNEPQTRIDLENSCARVVFRRMQDAVAALSHMQESPFYEKALFWLKSRESDVRELAKQSSKLSPITDKPFLSTTSTTQIKRASDTAKRGSAKKDRAIDDVLDNYCSRKPADNAKADNPICSQAKTVINDTQLSAHPHTSGKAPVADVLTSNAGIESIPTALRSPHACLNGATSATTLSCLEQGIPGSFVPIDISDRFTTLLHQVHDIVESIGFVL